MLASYEEIRDIFYDSLFETTSYTDAVNLTVSKLYPQGYSIDEIIKGIQKADEARIKYRLQERQKEKLKEDIILTGITDYDKIKKNILEFIKTRFSYDTYDCVNKFLTKTIMTFYYDMSYYSFIEYIPYIDSLNLSDEEKNKIAITYKHSYIMNMTGQKCGFIQKPQLDKELLDSIIKIAMTGGFSG